MQQVRNGGFAANIAAVLSQSASMFGWTTLDGIEIPFVQRSDGQTFFPVRIAERKFLSQFANISHFDFRNPLLSHYMYETEALALTSSGYGEVFTTRDLLVNLEEFRRFYEQVKEKFIQDSSKKPSADGGWVQINNTVVPYIVKDDSVMIPLAIVRCAAGLLVGRDVPVVYPAEDECRFLNDSCKSAGIFFDFTTATELVELVLMSCMCDQRPFVRQLPNGNPFSVADPVAEEVSNKVIEATGISDMQPSNPLPENTVSVSPAPYSGVSCSQQPCLANGSQSTGVQILNTHSLSQDLSECKSEPSTVHAPFDSSNTQLPAQYVLGPYLQPASLGPKHLPPCPNVVVTSLFGVLNCSKPMPTNDQWKSSGIQQKYTDHQNAVTFADQQRQHITDTCKINMQVTAANYASREGPLARNRTPPNMLARKTPKRPQAKIEVAKPLRESATDEEKQIQILQDALVPLAIIPDSDDLRAGDSLFLRRVQCYGKTITCMVKHDRLYILLEAMNRLYFPMRRLDTVIKAVTENLRLPVMSLTADEEKDFMKFYKLPADKLNSNKVISVDDFVGVYRSLQRMLDNSFLTARTTEPKTATVESPAGVNEGLTNYSIPVPVGTPVMNVSNTMMHQSRMAFNSATDYWVPGNDRLQSTAQSPSLYTNPTEKTVNCLNEMPKFGTICQNASEDGIDKKPPKRSRTRVIGDVICIDD